MMHNVKTIIREINRYKEELTKSWPLYTVENLREKQSAMQTCDTLLQRIKALFPEAFE